MLKHKATTHGSVELVPKQYISILHIQHHISQGVTQTGKRNVTDCCKIQQLESDLS